MHKLFTLAAAGLLAATTLSARAQDTNRIQDGILSPDELTGDNPYTLLGTYSNPRGFGDYGLLSVYAATDNNRIYLFLAGTVEGNGNAFQLFFKFQDAAGVPLGTALPGAAGSGTSFEKMTAKLDMAANAALALRYDTKNTQWIMESADLNSATDEKAYSLGKLNEGMTGSGQYSANLSNNDTKERAFSYLIAGYHTTTDGKVTSNPGYKASATDAGYGGVGSYGLELHFDRYTSDNVKANRFQLFVLQNSGDGSFLSSDYLPQATTAPSGNGNLGDASKVDFAAIPGTQAYTLNLGQFGGVTLPTRAGAAAVGLGVYPNPVAGVSSVSYRVPTAGTPVQVELLDLLGRRVRLLDSGPKAAGSHATPLSTGFEAAGTYLVRVQVGDDVATSRVVLQ